MQVKKSDWSIQEFNWNKIEAFYNRVAWDLKDITPYSELEDSLRNYLVDWISTEDINKLIVKSAIDLISPQNTKWEFIAWRFKVRILYKKWARANNLKHHSDKYSWDRVLELISDYTARGLYNKKILETYTIEEIKELANEIKEEYDFNYNSSTITTYEKTYLLNINWEVRELPQHLYLINALFLWIPEPKETRLDFVKKLYYSTTTWEISLPTPTLLNARAQNSQLSSCFILTPADDLRSIYHNIENMAQISKNWGGLWVYLGNIRSKGWSIKGIHWLSGWVTPWVKVINDTAIAVNQLGKRNWAISVTLDVFHFDIFHFLDLQTETWDIRGKSFDIFPAVSFPDLFFKRVEQRGSWSLFCPHEVEQKYWKRLQDCFWEEFEEFYWVLEADWSLKQKRTLEVMEVFKTYLRVVSETWMPYAFFRDTVNRLNPNKNSWNIYCTNLCTEIAQNQSENTFIAEDYDEWGNIQIKYKPWDTVVCNLASINIAKVNTSQKFAEIVPIVTRTLDNVITLNAYSIKEAEITAMEYRAIWIGTLWVAQFLAENKLLYWSDEANLEIDRVYKDLSFAVLSSSVELSKERWAYPAFKWSEYSKGKAFWEYISNIYNWFAWQKLETDIKLYWTRFWYHLAPAPNTSTAIVVGTTAWVVPVYRRYFVETNSKWANVVTAPNLNSENFWFYTEFINADLSKVINTVAIMQKRIDQSISFEWLINPAKTSPKELFWYYLQAWKSWLKTIYYVRSQSLEVWEACISCSW